MVTPTRSPRRTCAYRLQHAKPWIEGEIIAVTLSNGSVQHLPSIDIGYRVGVDGISLWLVVLTAFLMPLAVWSSSTAVTSRVREYCFLLLLLESALLGAFCALDLLLFYVFFEFTLVPLYFLIGIWGGPDRRKAASKFFIYTLTGSVLTFAGIVYLGYFRVYADGVPDDEYRRAGSARTRRLPPFRAPMRTLSRVRGGVRH